VAGRALITGGAGFLGSHLADWLIDDDWDVYAVDDLSKGRLERLADARKTNRLHFHQLDICDDELSEVAVRFKPDVVFHLAAQASVRPSVEDPILDARINVLGTINVLQAAAEAGAQRIVFASSGGAIYGEVPDKPATERSRTAPDSPYGISKLIVEHYFRFFRDNAGLDYVALAPGNIYGPRQDPDGEAGVVAIFCKRMLSGQQPVINGDGEYLRDYVYVQDVVDAFVRAGEIGGGMRLNVGTGIETSVNQLYEVIKAEVGYEGEAAHAPHKPGDLRRSVLDASLAKKKLGWEAWTSLPEGIEKTVAWFRG
jgi:UDP-glucose 4-epimerase